MSNSNKPRPTPHAPRCTTLLASVILLTLAAGATTLATGAVGLNAAAVGIPDKDKPSHTKTTTPSSLRCWQFGKLIFEETGVVPEQGPAGTGIAWTRPSAPGQELRLLTLGEATCLFKSSVPTP